MSPRRLMGLFKIMKRWLFVASATIIILLIDHFVALDLRITL